ncbi:MAG: DUF6079 family protein [Candidatus Heimdallarchaeota archaeon]
MKKLTTIGEIISIPDIDPVIKLAKIRDNIDEELKIMNTYIITKDVEQVMGSVLQSIAEGLRLGKGEGFWIYGLFGSGKSHFLGYLTSLLKEEFGWDITAQKSGKLAKFRENLEGRNFLIVQIPLLDFPSDKPLSSIVYSEIEESLRKKGETILLEDKGLFTQKFEEKLVEGVVPREKLEEYLKNLGHGSWEELRRTSFDDAVELASRFLESIELSIKIESKHSMKIENLASFLREKGYDGMVLAIDELSEYLSSRPREGFSEDMRFLQAIGELSENYPIWILATLQKVLEEIGSIDPEVLNKIRDRYSPYTLSMLHIEELIGERLVVKEKPYKIEEAYEILMQKFPDLRHTLPKDKFLKIYPVHPSTLDCLEQVMQYFSRTRSLVEFIHDEVKGNPRRGVPGILNEDFINLLTPDAVFDDFETRIEDRFSDKYLAYQYFEKNVIPKLELDDDRRYGLKLIKILAILKIANLEKNVLELTNMVMYGPFDSKQNYDYVNGLLRELASIGQYIGIRRGKEKFEEIYFLDVEIRGDPGPEVERYAEGLADDDRRLFTPLLSLVDILKDFEYGFPNEIEVQWNKTNRVGGLFIQNVSDITEDTMTDARELLKNSEKDFQLIIGLPFKVEEQKRHINSLLDEEEESGIIFWLPLEISDVVEKIEMIGIKKSLLEALKTYTAILKVQDDYKNDKTAEGAIKFEKLNSWGGEGRRSLASHLKKLYYDGRVYTTEGDLDIQLREYSAQPFDILLSKIVEVPLNRKYPKHPVFGRLLRTRGPANKIFNEFIKQGFVKDPVPRLKSALENYAEPMGIVERIGTEWKLKLEGSKAIEAIMNFMPETGERNYEEIYWRIRKSEFGIIDSVFELLVASLIKTGSIIGKKGKKIYTHTNISNLGTPISKNLTTLEKGQLINREKWSDVNDLSKVLLGESPRSYNLINQNELWTSFCNFKSENLQQSDRVIVEFKNMQDSLGYSDVNLIQVKRIIEKFHSVLESINEEIPSREGLESFLGFNEQFEENLELLKADYDKILEFVDSGMDKLSKIHRYLVPAEVPEAYEELYSQKTGTISILKDLEGIIFRNRLVKLEKTFNNFQAAYKNVYTSEHYDAKQAEKRETILKSVRKAPRYVVLTKLSGIEKIKVEHDIASLGLDEIARGVCERDVIKILTKKPICDCGFKLGDVVQNLSVEEIHERICSGCKEYLNALNLKTNKEKIISYIEQTNSKIGDQIRSLFNLDSTESCEKLINQLSMLVTHEVIDEINKALEGIKVKKRSLRKLINVLEGRTLPPSTVIEQVNSWLNTPDKPDQDTLIQIVGDQDGK